MACAVFTGNGNGILSILPILARHGNGLGIDIIGQGEGNLILCLGNGNVLACIQRYRFARVDQFFRCSGNRSSRFGRSQGEAGVVDGRGYAVTGDVGIFIFNLRRLAIFCLGNGRIRNCDFASRYSSITRT